MQIIFFTTLEENKCTTPLEVIALYPLILKQKKLLYNVSYRVI